MTAYKSMGRDGIIEHLGYNLKQEINGLHSPTTRDSILVTEKTPLITLAGNNLQVVGNIENIVSKLEDILIELQPKDVCSEKATCANPTLERLLLKSRNSLSSIESRLLRIAERLI